MAAEPRGRQREAYGGINWGSAFFGWLVAVAVGALLTALLAATGAAITLEEIDVDVDLEDEELGIGGAIGLVLIALIAYFTGGYVAGRMSRFDGAMQGLAVWIWAVVIAVVLALLGWLADQEYNLLAQLDLPRIPAEETLTGLGIGTLVVIFIGSALAAVGGGILGVGYHAKVDEAGAAHPPARDEDARRRTYDDEPRRDAREDERARRAPDDEPRSRPRDDEPPPP